MTCDSVPSGLTAVVNIGAFTRRFLAYLSASSRLASRMAIRSSFSCSSVYPNWSIASFHPVRDVPNNRSRCWTSFHSGSSKVASVIRRPILADSL